jgi:hypothetical protein
MCVAGNKGKLLMMVLVLFEGIKYQKNTSVHGISPLGLIIWQYLSSGFYGSDEITKCFCSECFLRNLLCYCYFI